MLSSAVAASPTAPTTSDGNKKRTAATGAVESSRPRSKEATPEVVVAESDSESNSVRKKKIKLSVDTSAAAALVLPTPPSTGAPLPAQQPGAAELPPTTAELGTPRTANAPTKAPASAAVAATPMTPSADKIMRAIIYGSYAQLLTDADRTPDIPADHSHKWKLFVQGYQGQDISSWCSSVVFRLHESFKEPRRVVTKAPFEIHETGWGEFECGIEVHFKDTRLKPVAFFHLLKLYPLDGNGAQSNVPPATPSPDPVLYERYEELLFSANQSLLMRDVLTTTAPAICNPDALSITNSQFEQVVADQEEKAYEKAVEAVQAQIKEWNQRKLLLQSQVNELKVQISTLEREAVTPAVQS